MQRHHHIDGVGGNPMVFHVKSDKHVFLCSHFHEASDVGHALLRVDEEAKGRGFDA